MLHPTSGCASARSAADPCSRCDVLLGLPDVHVERVDRRDGLLIVTPPLLLLARAHRFREEGTARPAEAVGLLLLLAGTTAWVFSRPEAMAFLVLPPLLLVAFRLSPPWTAAALILTATPVVA